jgi:homoserine O-acetyltransferase
MLMHEQILPKNVKLFKPEASFQLEQGGSLKKLQIAYHTYGKLSPQKDNVVWVCHALTANSDAADWWPGMIGTACFLDTDKYFIVCANVLGSYYGSTGPRSINPATGVSYGLDFPAISVRDQVKAHLLLMQHLGIEKLAICMGGSFGGHQCLEMAIALGDKINQLILLACSARETAWSIAIHEAQRMALETDQSFQENHPKAGAAGLKTARAIGLISYRTIEAYIQTQTDQDDEKYDDYRASSYVRYQGDKLEKRFHAHCYWTLSKCLDTHHIGRGRGSLEEVLASITIDTAVIGIPSDMLIADTEQKFIAQQIPKAKYIEIPSAFGHDGFFD